MKHPVLVKGSAARTLLVTTTLLLTFGLNVSAAIIFSGSSTFGGTGVSASASFSTDGTGDLFITLENTFAGGVPDQSHVLTGVFFSGANGLKPVANSAVASTGSTEWRGGGEIKHLAGGSILGQQWEYLSGISHAPGGATDGISSTGLGIFGRGNFASGGVRLGGSAYGILSAGYAGTTSGGLSGRTYIDDSMSFELSGFTGDLDDISDVSFQYGTSLNNVPSSAGNVVAVPEANFAAASALFLLPLAGLSLLRRRAHRS
jgi:hypothetical protein